MVLRRHIYETWCNRQLAIDGTGLDQTTTVRPEKVVVQSDFLWHDYSTSTPLPGTCTDNAWVSGRTQH